MSTENMMLKTLFQPKILVIVTARLLIDVENSPRNCPTWMWQDKGEREDKNTKQQPHK